MSAVARWISRTPRIAVTAGSATPHRCGSRRARSPTRLCSQPASGRAPASTYFTHWRADEVALRRRLPDGLELETCDESAWLGITPFRVRGLRLRGALPLPFLSAFPELNVRTYVGAGGKPGIWFFSLDAASRLAVAAARRSYHLPYHHARMTASPAEGRICYESERTGAERPYVFRCAYGPADEPPFTAEPGSLAHFLTERYCLYATDAEGALLRAEIHHRPWSLELAAAELEANTMSPDGVHCVGEPLLHLARRQDVVIWPPRPAGEDEA
jgi:uncharacterized protein YqjF (DUF2071 family)